MPTSCLLPSVTSSPCLSSTALDLPSCRPLVVNSGRRTKLSAAQCLLTSPSTSSSSQACFQSRTGGFFRQQDNSSKYLSRISGLMQSAILSGFALGAVALPGSYPHYLSMVQQLGIGPVLIFSTNFSVTALTDFLKRVRWQLEQAYSGPRRTAF